jgi:hypothetical protein
MCAIALAEAAKLSNDVLLQGVIETILKDSPILQNLPFIEIIGNGLTYKQMCIIDCQLAPSEKLTSLQPGHRIR